MNVEVRGRRKMDDGKRKRGGGGRLVLSLAVVYDGYPGETECLLG